MIFRFASLPIFKKSANKLLSWNHSVCRSFLSSDSSENFSYVKRMKLLQNLKEKPGLDENMMKKGKYLVFHKNKPLLTEKFTIAWMDYSDLNMDVQVFKQSSILLGLSDNAELQFSVQIANFEDKIKEDIEGKSDGSFSDFRLGLVMMPVTEAALISKANAINNWHRKNCFCAQCGSKLTRSASGSSRNCTDCKEVWYPTLSPVGIALVTDASNSKLLLVRQGRHPKGMYSCIAGFADSGETIEETIRREVAEEVGLTVQSVEYKCSQHWSFPTSNLMIGCHAIVDGSETIDIDHEELEDAKWFSIEEVNESLAAVKKNPMKAMFNKQAKFFVPPRGTTAHCLIDAWISNNIK